jgi:hypothetical protein
MRYTYFIHGLTVQVPFPYPSLLSVPSVSTPDVTVGDGRVPRALADAELTGDGWQAAKGRVLLRGREGVGNVLVEEGVQVTLERAPGAQDEALAIQMLDGALCIALQQRNAVVLHANAAVTPRGVVALCGESGIGKSTALSALLARGCAMLTDDVTACRWRDDGVVEVTIGAPHLYLPADAAAQLGHDISGLPRYPWRRMKAAVPTRGQMASAPAPLRTLYILRTHNADVVRVQPLTGAEKFSLVQQQLYGPLLSRQHAAIFPLLSALVRQVNVFLLWRPTAHWMVDDIVDIIMA